MATQDIVPAGRGGGVVSYFYDPRIRGIVYQFVVFVAIVSLVYWIIGNTIENLNRLNIASGFTFLNGRAGFDLSQTLVPFTSDSTYGRALYVGFLNTVLIAVVGIITASILGFMIGIGRLSRNWIIRKLCTTYVEVFRNIPPLLVIFFWYFGVLSVLPSVRESIALPFGSFLNQRGLFFPAPVWGEGAWVVGAAFIIGIIGALVVRAWATRRQMSTGQQFPIGLTAIGLIVGLPLLALIVTGFPLSFSYPVLGTFNLTGGKTVKPEFIALFLALSFYTASFIAEIVRAGILGVNKGQTEASAALGLKPGMITRLVVVPQAMRIIIPPLTSQYLNLTKNSSLAIAIGYPDLVAVGGTVLNQTGQSIEIVAIWMIIYLGLSLATSMLMNWFNAKMALVER